MAISSERAKQIAQELKSILKEYSHTVLCDRGITNILFELENSDRNAPLSYFIGDNFLAAFAGGFMGAAAFTPPTRKELAEERGQEAERKKKRAKHPAKKAALKRGAGK